MLPSSSNAARPARAYPGLAALLATLLALACSPDDQNQPQPGSDATSDGSLVADAKLVLCNVDTDCPAAVSPCAVPSCAATGYCIETPAPDGAACDDGDLCTSDTACAAGQCVGTFVCACQTDADCDKERQGNLCGATYYCDLSGATPQCRPKPNSEIVCDTSLDTTCSLTNCDPTDGKCKAQPAADGTACDDGALCTGPDACAAGVCTGPSSCACEADADCAKEEDGDPCNGTLFCELSSHSCKVNPATVVICASPAPGACIGMVCDPKDAQCKLGNLAEGTACDLDGSVCSLDSCAGGACQPGPLDAPCACNKDADCAIFEDGDVCNGQLYCSKASGYCELNPATVVSCATVDDAACIKNQCDPKTGQCSLGPVQDGAPCEDGWTCSKQETCQKGACVAAENLCECKQTADCGKFAAQNLCAQFYCHKPAGLCVPNPASVKVCAPAGDPACTTTACDPTDGLCKATPTNEGKACEADGSWCTSLDVCVDGSCKPAKNHCPCQKDGDCAPFEDDNLCNGTLYCDVATGFCLVNKATIPKCSGPGDGPCKPDQCDPKDGTCKALPLPTTATCDTDDFVCTVERCDGKGGCAYVGEGCLCWEGSDCAPWEDGDACNGTLYCAKWAGPETDKPGACKKNPASVVTCPTGLPTDCTVAVCDPADGVCKAEIAASQQGKACDDDDACTSGEVCKGADCVGAAIDVTATCDDANVCTADACAPANGCTHAVLPGAACEDGEVCTVNDVCGDEAACLPGAATVCDDGVYCTTDACVSGKGCTFTPHNDACDDGDACTKDDACNPGSLICVGAAVDCDDGNVCTTDSCDSGSGCVAAANAAPCSDGDACTDSDVCKGGACSPGGAVVCNDNNPCTKDACLPASGCTQTADDSGVCSDDDPCTGVETCKGGTCVHSAPPTCDDENPCTNDACVTALGCKSTPNSAPCNDGDACTSGDLCAGGVCKPGAAVDCDDGNLCTDDSCNKSLGCKSVPGAAGGPCVGGVCDPGGICTPIGGAPAVAVGSTVGMVVAPSGNTTALYGFGKATVGLLPGAPNNGPFGVAKVPGSDDARLVSLGIHVGCLVDKWARLRCWGSSANGSKIDAPVPGLPKVGWVSVREARACVVSATGDVHCRDNIGTWSQALAAPAGAAWHGVSLGTAHQCAWQRSGEVRCWGKGYPWGQLGVGTMPSATVAAGDATPVQKAGGGALGDVQQVCSGASYSCARQSNGAVWCWGRGSNGEIGDGQSTDALVATQVQGSGDALFGFVAKGLGCGERTVCAQTDGDPYCWGRGEQNETGYPVSENQPAPRKISGVPLGATLGHGMLALCAAKDTNVVCWGNNELGALALYKPASALDPFVPSPVLDIEGAVLGGVTALTGHAGLFLATSAGKRYGWGDSTGRGLRPATPAALVETAQVAWSNPPLLQAHSPTIGCIQASSGEVRCWGENSNGYVLGKTGGPTKLSIATAVDNVQGVQKLWVGRTHSCGLYGSPATELRCWGRNADGELGRGSKSPVGAPAAVPNFVPIEVGIAQGRTCAIDDQNDVWCWGRNNYGAAGQPNGSDTTAPVKINGPKMSKLAMGSYTTCGITADGTGKVYCWGYNGGGINVLGARITDVFTPTPVLVAELVGVTDVALGHGTDSDEPLTMAGCAVHGIGNVSCWGNGVTAMLATGAQGAPTAANQPVKTSYFSDAKSIVGGNRAFCVLRATGQVWCWGQRGWAQTGEGVSSVAQPTPYAELVPK